MQLCHFSIKIGPSKLFWTFFEVYGTDEFVMCEWNLQNHGAHLQSLTFLRQADAAPGLSADRVRIGEFAESGSLSLIRYLLQSKLT